MSTYKIDLTGQRFGKLTVLEHDASRPSRGGSFWICICDCETRTSVYRGNLLAGKTQSCGCLHRELLSRRQKSHGRSHSAEYRLWAGMITRCTNPRRKQWNDYGGRGITVCDRWRGREGFENFLADIGPRPSPAHSLDRFPDNDGNYEPGNVRWATRKQQNKNRRPYRRNSVIVTYQGQKMSLSKAALLAGIKSDTAYARYHRGWSVSDLLKPIIVIVLIGLFLHTQSAAAADLSYCRVYANRMSAMALQRLIGVPFVDVSTGRFLYRKAYSSCVLADEEPAIILSEEQQLLLDGMPSPPTRPEPVQGSVPATDPADAPVAPVAPKAKTASTDQPLCSRHGLRTVYSGKRWNCRK